jgi:hypothetical protein
MAESTKGASDGGFEDVILGSTEEHACSPVFEMDELGIKISAPKRVEAVMEEGSDDVPYVSESTRFPICITMQIPTKLFVKFPEVSDRVTLVAVEHATGKSHAKNLTSTRTRVPTKRYDLPPEFLENAVDVWRYNVNLSSFIHLSGPGRYHVYVTFEDYRSNTVAVEVE